MARKFFFVCAVILMLAGSALGAPVDPNAPNGIAASITEGELYGWVHLRALCINGEQYRYEISTDGSTHGWIHNSSLPPLPVSVSEIADWGLFQIKTHSGDLYILDGSAEAGEYWKLVGGPDIPPIPCGPVSTDSQKLGDAKSLYR